jgi:osmotically-inducible protein OsmY
MLEDREDLKSLVTNALLTADGFGKVVIEVKDLDGTIMLKGVVESEEDRSSIEALVKEQTGVVDVINDLRVSTL